MIVPSDGDEDMTMEVEPAKTVFDYVQEWVDYYAGERESPHESITEVIEQVPTTGKKRVPSTTTVYNREQDDLLYKQEKKRRLFNIIEGMVTTPKVEPRHVQYIGDDTKLERLFRFRDITIKPTDNTVRGRSIAQGEQYVQDPYDYTDNGTWRNRRALALVNAPKLWYDIQKKGTHVKKDFDELYDRTIYQKTDLGSYSRAEIFILEVAEQNRDKFKEILYGDTQVLMKLTPFINNKGQLVDDLDIEQIYNEIRIAYFLNELLYNYSNVLSVHFMVMVDWFQTSRAKLGLFANPRMPTTIDAFYNQITITEFGHTSMLDFLSEHLSFETLRAVIFQVMHALETAWHTNEFVHYDLHIGNVQMKRTDYDESPFKGMNLLYKRRNVENDWYVLDNAHLGEHIVKIIDFGFSRIYAPSSEEHLLYALGPHHPPHLHDKFIGLSWPKLQMNPANPNRYTDVRLFFLTLFALPQSFWEALTIPERETFYAFASQVLDFDGINLAIDATGFRSEVSNIRRYSAGGRLTAANLASCRPCIDFLMSFGGYARSQTTVQRNNWTATDVLNQPFFDALKRRAQDEPSIDYMDRATRTDLVVSFIDADTRAETQMLKVKPSRLTLQPRGETIGLSCSMCKGKATHYTLQGELVTPLCGTVCAEFKHIYNGKTVFRK